MLEALCYTAAFILFALAAVLPPTVPRRWMLTNAGLALAVLPSAVEAFKAA
ncbi:membrane protein [Streptomyces phage Lizz]|jgi:hypothetical protein|nr:membrane protein [Streptomyces phage PHTowN]QNO12918.1 membrane protein [Streptomyces phage ShakeNBake]QYW07648.1 membrane protein [Streptomyces phage Lizz]